MSTDTQTTNGDDRDRSRNVNLRFFLAGGTATAALILGAIILFGALGTYVAFNDGSEPDDGRGDSEATIALSPAPGANDSSANGAPEAAAAPAIDAASAVAAGPSAPTAVAPAPTAVGPGTGVDEPRDGDRGPGEGDDRDGPSGGSEPPDGGVEPPEGDTPPPGGNDQPLARPRLLGETVEDLEHTAGNLGLQVQLAEATRELTDPLDYFLQDTLNGVGALLNEPKLGDELSLAANQLTQALLGEGGLTDILLGGAKKR